MKKRKILTYETSQSQFSYDLGQKKLTFSHNDLSLANSYIPLNISHEYQINEENDGYGKGFKLNIEQELIKTDNDSYKLVLANGEEEIFDELYYINKNNKREYIAKEKVTVLPDSTLEYEGKKVFKELKNNKGISLSGDYTDFINGDKVDFRHQDLVDLENSILQIKQTIENLNYNIYEYSKYNDEKYSSLLDSQSQYNLANENLSKYKSASNYIVAMDKYYNLKNAYYSKTSKKIKTVGGLIQNGSSDYIFSESVERMTYVDTDAYNADKYGTYAKYNDETKNDDGDTVTTISRMSLASKQANYYSQVYQNYIDQINQQIQAATSSFEIPLWNYQKAINGTESAYLKNKNAYDQEALEKQKEYYAKILPLTIELKAYYEKLLFTKEYEREQLLKIIPQMYLSSNDGLVYGFNNIGKLCVIFDAFEHQILIEYNDSKRIKDVIDEKGNSINFVYNDSNNLVKMYNDEGNYINYEYSENDYLIKIIYSDETLSTLEYNYGYLYKYIDVNKQGYYIQYINGEITQIKDLYVKPDTSESNDYIDSFVYDDCHVSITNNKNDMISNYIFDENKYIVTEYSTKDNELYSISSFNYNDKCCSFDMTYNKANETLVLIDNLILDSTNNRKVGYEVSLFNDYSTDYILYAFADGRAINALQRHKTKYCDEISSNNVFPSRFELSCVIKYEGLEEVEYAVSFNKNITGKQFIALPITLEEDENGKLIKPISMTVYADFSGNSTNCTISNLSLALGDYVYSEYNEAYNKTSDYYSEAHTVKTVMGEKQGYYLNKRKIDYIYNYNELVEKQIETIYYEEYDLNNILVSNDTKINTKSYKYNSNNKVLKEEDSKGNVVEYLYNDQGLCILKKSYYKTMPNQALIEECEYDENGKVIKEANSLGFNQEYRYINQSNSIVTTPNGNIINIQTNENTESISSEIDGIENYNNSVYELNRLVEYNTNGMKYRYTYDDYGREKEFYINDKLYCSFSYIETLSTIKTKTLYTNNSGFEKITDKYGHILKINKIIANTTIKYKEYVYDDKDRVIKEIEYNGNNEFVTSYNYIEETLSSITTNDYTKHLNLDMYSREIETTYQIDDDTYKYESEYNDDLLNKYSLKRNNQLLYQEELKVDKLNRLVNNTNTLLTDSYTYLSKNGRTTNLISLNQKNINGNIKRYKYNYDNEGNIISKNENHSNTRYTYDKLNRLIREDNKVFNKTFIYNYDSNGNILNKKIYDYSLDEILENEEIIEYNYSEFNDYLTKYDNKEIKYDVLGNPIIYKDKKLNFEIHDLVKYDNISFSYNTNHIRVSKLTPNRKIDYILDGKTILKEKITKYSTNLYSNDRLNNNETINSYEEEIEYIYSKSGVIGFRYNNEIYYYNKNILGDILEIYDSKYNLVGKYEYDAWGNHIIITNINNIANLNPFRYRSYYYDIETNLYYLQSRYYDPQTHRFINMDSIEYLDPENINGLNLYAYCGNNPVMRTDSQGTNWWTDFWNGVGNWFSDNWVKLAIGAGAIALGVLTMGAATLISGAGMAAALSAMGTAAVSSLVQVGISTAISAGIGLAVGGITSGSWEGAVDGMLNGIADGFMWGGIFAGAGQVLSGAMRITRTLAPNFNGAQIGRVKLWSPNATGNPNTGGTLIKFGRFNRIDSEIGNMIHIHLKLLGRTINHFPIGMIAGGIIGGF